MSEVFFQELDIPAPGINLEVGSGTGTEQTARIMLALEEVLTQRRPDLLLVVGDVNSTMATALVGAKHLIPIAHVEAGLRSGDRTMPEEVNRLVTDRLSDLLLTTERQAADNLILEGVRPQQIHFVGNVMIDTLHANLSRAAPAAVTMADHGADKSFVEKAAHGFGFVTLHRPSNVDVPAILGGLLTVLGEISAQLPLVFAVHPRTRASLEAHGLSHHLAARGILATPPLAYLQALGLMRAARLVVTDSGGIQEETTALGVPCLTVRENTERPITITEGTNTLIGTSPEALRNAIADVLASGGKRGRVPEFWDGHAAERIVDQIAAYLAQETRN